MSREYLSDIHLQNSLFRLPCNQQMVVEIELEALNEIGRGNFASTLMEIQLIEWWIDTLSK